MVQDQVVAVYKPEGLTPLEALNRFRDIYPVYRKEKLSYAGRLDPLAEGVMPVLVGEAVKRPEESRGWDKEYLVEILFGASTDTGDVMGLAEEVALPGRILEADLSRVAISLLGTRSQTAPKFSSPGLSGKNFKREVTIFELTFKGVRRLAVREFVDRTADRLARVSGDFRQTEILTRWLKHLPGRGEFQLASFLVSCSAGTYLRVLGPEIGRELGKPALVYTIQRTRVGPYVRQDCFEIA